MTFAGGLELVAVDLGDRVLPRGGELRVRLWLRSTQRQTRAARVRLQWSGTAASAHLPTWHLPGNGVLSAAYWPIGALIEDEMTLHFTGGRLGTLQLAAGMDRSGKSLAALDGRTWIELGQIQVTRRAREAPQ